MQIETNHAFESDTRPGEEKMTNREFASWRARHFNSRRACALALGLDPRAVGALEAGATRNGTAAPIPAHVALACAAWTIGLRDYDGGAVTIG